MIVGWGALLLGAGGLVMPFVPGVVPLVFGLSVVTFRSRYAHRLSARLRSRHPDIAMSLKRFETWCAAMFHLSSHTHEYVHIPSPHGTLQGLLEVSHHRAGVAILLHSATGTVETAVQNVLAEVCRMQGMTVLRFDARHGLNETGATFTDFTTTAYREDFVHVLAWARGEPWYAGPLTLVGHSVGALVALLYAEEHPEEVAQLLLLAPTVSGTAYVDAFNRADPAGLAAWKEQRLRVIRHPLSGEQFSLSYGFVEDLMHYDAAPRAAFLTMPVTIVAGSADVTSPPELCVTFAQSVGTQAQVLLVPGMRHNPTEHHELRALLDTLYTCME